MTNYTSISYYNKTITPQICNAHLEKMMITKKERGCGDTNKDVTVTAVIRLF